MTNIWNFRSDFSRHGRRKLRSNKMDQCIAVGLVTISSYWHVDEILCTNNKDLIDECATLFCLGTVLTY